MYPYRQPIKTEGIVCKGLLIYEQHNILNTPFERLLANSNGVFFIYQI